MEYFKYDKDFFKFRNIIEDILDTNHLESIHLIEDYSIFERGTDQSTKWHQLYYSNLDKFLPTYKLFIYDVIKPIFGEDIVYQKIPTFRTQLVNNLGVFAFHKDLDYQHNQEELNFFLPFTDAYSNNTIWVESKEDLGDYSPMNTLYGEVVMFNGCHLSHGNKLNTTLNTRVSCDFRVIPVSKYKEDFNSSTIYTNMKFIIGDYYEVTSLKN
jgi:ectoine hydroxylase-related dioxygenase (phytanoyl-CoA dioxygenase family)